MSSRRCAFAAVLTVAWLVQPPAASAVTLQDASVLNLDGSWRTVTALSRNYRADALFGPGNKSDGQSESLLRLIASGILHDNLSYEIHGVQRFLLQTRQTSGTAFGQPGLVNPSAAHRLYSGRYVWANEGDVNASMFFDRLALKLTLPFGDLTLGRQAISFATTYFWNPLDVFLAFEPNAFDRDYKGGVDAIRLDVPIGDLSLATLVVTVAGRDNQPNLWESSALLRYTRLIADWESSWLFGKMRGGFIAGLGATGEVAGLAVRFEGTHQEPINKGRPSTAPKMSAYTTFVLGLGRRFESSLDLEMEYLFNGGSKKDLLESFVALSQGWIRAASRHVVGAMASYELTPLVRVSTAAIVSLSDRSFLLQPGFIYSAADEVDVLVGAMVALGARPRGLNFPLASSPEIRSEYGLVPDMGYVEVKVYF